MRKVKVLIIVLLVVSIITGLTAGLAVREKNTQQEPVFWAEMPANTNPNLKYFGYYHFSDDRIEEVAAYGHSNICKVDGDDTQELMRLLDNGFYVLIMIRHMFFSNNETPTDWSERWEAVKAVINPHIDKVLGFCVDEPIRRDFPNLGTNIGKSLQSFHFACQKVLQDYPDKKMMSVLTLQDLSYQDYSKEYYKYCTDLGYDYYPTWDKESVVQNISILKNKIAVFGQNIWLIPKAFYTILPKDSDLYWLIEDCTLPIGKDILDWIKGTYELAVSDHRVVGIFSFVYDNDTLTASLRRFFRQEDEYYNSEIFGVYNQIGRAIIANNK